VHAQFASRKRYRRVSKSLRVGLALGERRTPQGAYALGKGLKGDFTHTVTGAEGWALNCGEVLQHHDSRVVEPQKAVSGELRIERARQRERRDANDQR
jgi:hypothetical protein